MEDMTDESERMSRLVNDLLVLARADAGRPLRREIVQIKPLIEDVCRKAKTLDPRRMIDCDDLIDVAVQGDPDALKQVLLILLDNAMKFTPVEGAVTLAMSKEADSAVVCVRDTGVGIASDALPHIFERFYRGDSSRTGAGSGLGLAIAKTLVEAHGGTISAESVVGQGSTFSVRIPQVESTM